MQTFKSKAILIIISFLSVVPVAALAQYAAPPPLLAPSQLDNLVASIALYPDPLLAQVLAASTYPNPIPDAAQWAAQHSYLTGDALARSIAEDNLPFDPSVQALLPFPSVLDMMARDLNWTTQLGNAFLAQQAGVMEAVQRMRQRALDYGYLQSNQYVRVISAGPGILQIEPVNSGYIYVPYYSPGVVFVPRRPGVAVGGVISFGHGVTLGLGFRPWGWGPDISTVHWPSRTVIIDRYPWNRTWANRSSYDHRYSVPRNQPGPRVERHDIRRGEHADRERREGREREERRR